MVLDPKIAIYYSPFKKKWILSAFSGRIDKLYQNMYAIAEDIAIHEMKKYDTLLSFSSLYREYMLKGEYDDVEEIHKKVHDYRNQRVEYHMKVMKEILFKILESEANEKQIKEFTGALKKMDKEKVK